MMNRLQTLFNRLAGISDHAAPNSLSQQARSFTALEKPACWRRRTRKVDSNPGSSASRDGIH